jgi:hypothetical protein
LRFNLYYEVRDEALVRRLKSRGRPFGALFAAHEGVHTGNARARLFVDRRRHAGCRPLIRRGSEVTPMQVNWAGGWIDLGPRATARGNGVYFSLGSPEYFAPGTILVRRTGDRVIAAVNREGLHAGNNLFCCVPRAAEADAEWTAFVLNSPIITWLFRYTQPRAGRAFSELKITHLEDFPIPRRPTGWRLESSRKSDGGWDFSAVDRAFGWSPGIRGSGYRKNGSERWRKS